MRFIKHRPTHANSVFARFVFASTAAAVFGLALTHCATTPIQKFLRAQAPGYRALQPVSAKDLRGLHLHDPDSMNTATNRCFRGELDDQAYASFAEYTQTYSGGFTAGTEIARDFGGALGAGEAAVGGGRVFNGAITLGDVREYRMNSVFFDPASACAQEKDSRARLLKGDTTIAVITRVLKAGTIRASSADGTHLNLRLAVTEFGGKLEQKSQDAQSWRGANLFFAALPQKYRVAVKESEREIGQKSKVVLDDCGVTLSGYNPDNEAWSGSVNCKSGRNTAVRNQPVTEWVGIQVEQGGVSYSLNISPLRKKPGAFAAHLIRWTAIETAD